MHDPKTLLKILFLVSSLCLCANADTESRSVSNALYQSLNVHNQELLQHSFKDKQLITTQAKNSSIKLGLVFSPEDLITAIYENDGENYREQNLTTIHSGERIIGFYFKSFF